MVNFWHVEVILTLLSAKFTLALGFAKMLGVFF